MEEEQAFSFVVEEEQADSDSIGVEEEEQTFSFALKEEQAVSIAAEEEQG